MSGEERFRYLQALVTEFQDTDSTEAKEQVLANLANFSYDPGNISDLQKLQVPELFLDMLTEDNENLVEFGMGGICNLCAHRSARDHMVSAGGVRLIISCLSSRREETVLSAMTALIYLCGGAGCLGEVTAPAVVECMLRFSLSHNRRFSNLAQIFLDDYCSQEQVEEARTLSRHTALGIPLPEDSAPPTTPKE